jgi:hypothetical protein
MQARKDQRDSYQLKRQWLRKTLDNSQGDGQEAVTERWTGQDISRQKIRGPWKKRKHVVSEGGKVGQLDWSSAELGR